jgi:isopentenyl diphosphate isomerase/L-lactate dehydrogenase-like FMN-dependent dehydrogenase
MRTKLSLTLLTLLVLVPAAPAAARSSIRVGVADQSPAMFANPYFKQLKIKRTRYFVRSDVMQNAAELAKATTFVTAARAAGVSTLIHVSTTDLRSKHGAVVSTTTYKRNAGKIVAYFRKLGVKDFGAWNEVNHASQETWNRIGNAVSYYKSMYTAVKSRCKSCAVVGLDVLDQAGVDRYIKSFYARLSSTWRKRLTTVGIHDYSDVNRNRSSGTKKIIDTVRHYNRQTKFWFTEVGALASFGKSFPYSEARQTSRMKNVFSIASTFRTRGVQRVYEYNFFGIENSTACGSRCRFDAGLVDPDGTPRPVFSRFKQKLASYSR